MSSSARDPGASANGGRQDQAAPSRPSASGTVNGNGIASGSSKTLNNSEERVYFDKQSGTWKCEVEGGGEVEWDVSKQAWIPVLDEDVLRAQQAAYSVEGVDEETPAGPIVEKEERKRRKQENAEAGPSKPRKQPKVKVSTKVYVSGLPLDCTKAEIASVFSRYGVINEDDTGEARIKLYHDERTGMFKGEALITYFKPESVDLAIKLLDDSCLRAAEGQRDPIMKVQKPDYSGRSNNHSSKKKEPSLGHVDGEQSADLPVETPAGTSAEATANPTPPPPPPAPRVRTEAEKRKATKRFEKMNVKLTDWDSDSDPELDVMAGAASNMPVVNANIRQVCLRRMFTLAELDEDPSLLLDLKEDVREECETLGKVTNVVLWDKEPEGIMTVKFGSHEAAMACVQKMDGRFFGGRQVIAYLLEGKPRFRRSGRGDIEEEEEEGGGGDSHKRQDAFGEWLEAGAEQA